MIQHTIYGIYGKAVLAVLAMMLSFTAFAQVTVSGVVTDETDQPMIGAGVMQKGTGNGTVTDIDGKFTLVVPSDAVLVFNYISYKTVEVNVAGQTRLNVQLLPDNTVLDEVVVIGYGTMKRSDLTGSVSSVSAKSIENFKTASVVDALGGQIAGVNVTMADGTP
ncbi:MAG: carboxypeptidase-like regulatory domain-containing protein, partial [Bacteroidales bacterium]|nr:carboxypeptidase-like regulatory domain-containing protein [Bacteroidales bacterium]